MLRLYDSLLSGNSWKVRILLSQLPLRYERVTLDLARGDTHRPDFRNISRFSRIPALVIDDDDGRTIVESGAILTYLAEGTDLLPADSYLRAEVLSWLFFEQADLQKAIAISRVYHLRGQAAQMADEIRHRQNDGYAALDHLEDWIVSRKWLVENCYTIADIACFAYVSLASEGGYQIERYPGINAWLERVRSTDGWVPLLEHELVAS